VVTIKKRIIIILIIITGFILFTVLNKEDIPTEPAKQLLQDEVENKDDTTASKEDTEQDKKEVSEVVGNEDPVKDFLSDKFKKAIDFFFTQDIKVVTLGDSLTEGSGDETKNGGYVGVLDDTINQDRQIVEFQNFAKRGSQSSQLLHRLEDDDVRLALADADIVLITIGANDIMHIFKENFTDLTLDKFTSEQIRYEQRLEKIFLTIREINEDADVYLIGFYNPFREYFADVEELEYIVESWNQIGSDVTLEFEYTYFIPIKDIFDHAETNYFAEDKFHPNSLGYRKMAERILQYVLNEGESNVQTEETIE